MALPPSKLEQRRHSLTHTLASDLAGLLPLWPGEIADGSRAGIERRLSLLKRALRAERRRGLAGHWTYDLARHVALLNVFRRELAQLQKSGDCKGPALLPAGCQATPKP